MKTQSPSQKGGGAPNFRPMSCGQTAGWIKMALGMEVGLGLVHIVLDTAPLLKKGAQGALRGQSPLPFSAHLYCGQMAGCIKIRDLRIVFCVRIES